MTGGFALAAVVAISINLPNCGDARCFVIGRLTYIASRLTRVGHG